MTFDVTHEQSLDEDDYEDYLSFIDSMNVRRMCIEEWVNPFALEQVGEKALLKSQKKLPYQRQ